MADPSASSDVTETPDAAAPWLTRGRVNVLIVTILVAQLVLPLRYYLGFAEGDDERFSWRMFSRSSLMGRKLTRSDGC